MVNSFILTGFLGVGKTTLLSSIIKEHFRNKKVALIVNEFGSIGIDGSVLNNVHSEVLEISEGCICCQLADTFNDGVKEIIQKYNPDIIFVETSGASEPLPILYSMHKLGISIEGVICVVDSKNFDQYKENSSAKHQIGGSNIILLNKTDLVAQEKLVTLTKEIKEIKDEYDVKDFTGNKIFNNYVIEQSSYGKINSNIFQGLYKASDILKLSDEAVHKHTQKDLITQKVGYIKNGTTVDELETLFGSLGQNIYRVKGIVQLSEVAKPQLINYAFGCVSNEDFDGELGESVLVFIGQSIEQDINLLAKKFEFLILPQFRVKL